MAYKALETTVTDFEADVAALSNICVVSVVPGASAGDLVVIYEQRYTPAARSTHDRVTDQPDTKGIDRIPGTGK